MAEMYGKATGCSDERGGALHLFDAEANFFGGNAIVGGGCRSPAGSHSPAGNWRTAS